MGLVVYTTSLCGYCMLAKSLLARRGFPFTEVDVSFDKAKRAWLAEVTGHRSVPQIFLGDRPLGGYRELSELVASGELARLVPRDGAP